AQHDACLERVQDVVIPPRFRIGDDVSHKKIYDLRLAIYEPNNARKSYIVNRKLKRGCCENYLFLARFFAVGRVNSTSSGISKPILSSMISVSAISATPIFGPASING